MTVYLNMFYRGKIGGSVSIQFDTEAEARQELLARAGGNEIVGTFGGNYGGIIKNRDAVRAHYTIETSGPS